MNKVLEYRRKCGLTQAQLSEKANISRPFLSNVENGVAIPSVDKASAIAAALNCTLNDLFQQDCVVERRT